EKFYNSAVLAQGVYHVHDSLFNLTVQSFGEVLFGNAYPKAPDILSQIFREIIKLSLDGSAVSFIISCDHVQKSSAVFCIFSNGTNLVQGRGVSHQSVTGYRALS